MLMHMKKYHTIPPKNKRTDNKHTADFVPLVVRGGEEGSVSPQQSSHPGTLYHRLVDWTDVDG